MHKKTLSETEEFIYPTHDVGLKASPYSAPTGFCYVSIFHIGILNTSATIVSQRGSIDVDIRWKSFDLQTSSVTVEYVYIVVATISKYLDQFPLW